MTALVRQIALGDPPRTVVVRELTVGELRAWLKGLEAKLARGDLIDALLLEDFALLDFALFTDLPPGAIDELAPSQLRELLAVIQEVNPDFFAMAGRMAQAGRSLAPIPPPAAAP